MALTNYFDPVGIERPNFPLAVHCDCCHNQEQPLATVIIHVEAGGMAEPYYEAVEGKLSLCYPGLLCVGCLESECAECAEDLAEADGD